VVIRSRPATARTAKTRPAYAIDSVDHALRLAAMLQLEGALTVSDAADRLGVARSTAHRVLAMLVYRDFAVQGSDRRYHAGPVLELATHSRSLTARLRTVALPHLEGLVAVLGESANLIIRTGDRVRFIASAESTQALRVEQREGMVFPAHLVSGGLVLLAEASEAEVSALYAGGVAGWVAGAGCWRGCRSRHPRPCVAAHRTAPRDGQGVCREPRDLREGRHRRRARGARRVGRGRRRGLDLDA
jgi:DNA-binding MarR family transcriptional regulator